MNTCLCTCLYVYLCKRQVGRNSIATQVPLREHLFPGSRRALRTQAASETAPATPIKGVALARGCIKKCPACQKKEVVAAAFWQ